MCDVSSAGLRNVLLHPRDGHLQEWWSPDEVSSISAPGSSPPPIPAAAAAPAPAAAAPTVAAAGPGAVAAAPATPDDAVELERVGKTGSEACGAGRSSEASCADDDDEDFNAVAGG
jgi:hypothetical protein